MAHILCVHLFRNAVRIYKSYSHTQMRGRKGMQQEQIAGSLISRHYSKSDHYSLFSGNIFFRAFLAETQTVNRYSHSGTNSRAMCPMMRCEKQPQVSEVHLSSFSESQAHSLRSGTPNPRFCWERGDSTNMGLRVRTSMKGHSRARLLESSRLKALVAEQSVRQGSDFSPRKEERLIIALRRPRFAISRATSALSAAIPTQFMLMMSTMNSKEKAQNALMSEIPTLLTSSAMSSCRSSDSRASHLAGSELSLKLKAMVRSSLLAKCAGRMAARDSLVFSSFSGLREMRSTLKPSCVRTSQKPRPMPSVAPVTTAQLRLVREQQLAMRSGMGMSCLTRVTSSRRANLRSGSVMRMAARTFQFHCQVSGCRISTVSACSIQLIEIYTFRPIDKIN